jgi:hypothetical protein
MWLISTGETGVPSGSELILVLLDDLLDLTQLYPREPLVPNQLNIRAFSPKSQKALSRRRMG